MDPDFVRPWNRGYLVWCVVLLGGMLALEPVVRVACEAVLDGRTPRPLALEMRCVEVMEVQGGELSGDSYFWWWILPMGATVVGMGVLGLVAEALSRAICDVLPPAADVLPRGALAARPRASVETVRKSSRGPLMG